MAVHRPRSENPFRGAVPGPAIHRRAASAFSLACRKNRLAYEPGSDLTTLAAAYLFGLVKNHGYVDGNKRVGFAAAGTFLLLNGLRLTASEADAYDAVMGAVEGRRTESDIAEWLRENTEPVRLG
jgi:death on curing protein